MLNSVLPDMLKLTLAPVDIFKGQQNKYRGLVTCLLLLHEALRVSNSTKKVLKSADFRCPVLQRRSGNLRVEKKDTGFFSTQFVPLISILAPCTRNQLCVPQYNKNVLLYLPFNWIIGPKSSWVGWEKLGFSLVFHASKNTTIQGKETHSLGLAFKKKMAFLFFHEILGV